MGLPGERLTPLLGDEANVANGADSAYFLAVCFG
jgi:hypothetical protein